jgi:hypothetical protein
MILAYPRGLDVYGRQAAVDAAPPGYVYVGSANATAAAWGRITHNARLHILNYELGIVLALADLPGGMAAVQATMGLDGVQPYPAGSLPWSGW